MKRTTKTLIPLAASAALLLPLAPSAGAVETAPAHWKTATAATATTPSVTDGRVDAAISRDAVINNAKTWLTANDGSQVPYSQTQTWGGYRMDCSGYVAMALQLPKPGPNTVGLADSAHTSKINMADLKKGDLVIDPVGNANTRHVVIFEKWVDSNKTAYHAYEQRGGHGTDYRQLKYGLGSDEYDAYRPNKF